MDIIGPEGSPLLIVQDDSGARFKLTPAQCLDGSVVMAINQRDTLEDQFTGEDLGASMAAAEGFDHSRQLFSVGDRVRIPLTGQHGEVVEVGASLPAGWSYLVKRDDSVMVCFLGDELEALPPLPLTVSAPPKSVLSRLIDKVLP